MRQLRDPVWQVRGTSWVWDEEARNQICAASEVWSLRQFLRARGNWPDDLPSNGGRTLVVAGLDGSLDLLTPTDAEAWLGDAIKPYLQDGPAGPRQRPRFAGRALRCRVDAERHNRRAPGRSEQRNGSLQLRHGALRGARRR